MRDFVAGTVGKTCGLGGMAAALGGLVIGAWFGLSIAVGAGLAAGNLAALAALGRRLFAGFDGDPEMRKVVVWVTLLSLKLGLLLGFAFAAVVLFGVDPLGLAVGYTTFVVATAWQTYVAFGS